MEDVAKPQWRWEASGVDYEPMPDQILKGKALFRAGVYTVQFVWRMQNEILKKRIATREEEARQARRGSVHVRSKNGWHVYREPGTNRVYYSNEETGQKMIRSTVA